jgi:hypothetical protein
MAYWFSGWRLVLWFLVAFVVLSYVFSQTLTSE